MVFIMEFLILFSQHVQLGEVHAAVRNKSQSLTRLLDRGYMTHRLTHEFTESGKDVRRNRSLCGPCLSYGLGRKSALHPDSRFASGSECRCPPWFISEGWRNREARSARCCRRGKAWSPLASGCEASSTLHVQKGTHMPSTAPVPTTWSFGSPSFPIGEPPNKGQKRRTIAHLASC